MTLHMFQREKRLYELEVDAEAARLIREGYAPLDALERAGTLVRAWRQRVVLGGRGEKPEAVDAVGQRDA